MKRRNREVNIFSVSLLDILCGALGAFCFMTIVLMPYYKPNVADAKELQQKQQELQEEIERLKAALSNTPNGRELMRQLEQLQRRIQEMQGQMNQQARQLEQERKEKRKLQDRNPVVVSMAWEEPSANVDLYARAMIEGNPEKSGEAVDPEKRQSSRFNGDTQLFCGRGPCFETALLRDNPAGWSIEVYYKYLASTGGSVPVLARGYYQHEGRTLPLPPARLERPGTAIRVGTIRITQDRKTNFTPSPAFANDYKRILDEWTKPAN